MNTPGVLVSKPIPVAIPWMFAFSIVTLPDQ